MTQQHRIVALEPMQLPEMPEVDVELDDVQGSNDVNDSNEIGATYLPDPALGQSGARWQQIQAGFVDDPRRSVAEAHQLVSELVEHIVQEFTRERNALERQWSEGEQVSTEDLRVCLQRYRSFFTRLLPTAPQGS